MKKKMAELLNVIFGFRKFILMLILYTVGIVFRINDLLSGKEMVDLFTGTTIAFFSANGVEHIVNCVKDIAAGKRAPATVEEVVPNEGAEVAPEEGK